MTVFETLGNLLRFVGLFIMVAGLWFSAGGMRVVVSGRIDERRRSAMSLKKALLLLMIGVALLVIGTMVVNRAIEVAI